MSEQYYNVEGKQLTLIKEIYNPYHGYVYLMSDGNYYKPEDMNKE